MKTPINQTVWGIVKRNYRILSIFEVVARLPHSPLQMTIESNGMTKER